MKLVAKMWVAVLDGGQGVILANQGTALEPRLVALRQYGHTNPPSHELGRDSPGRVHEATGQHRSAVEAPDPHQKAEDRFVVSVMADLEKEAAAGAYEKIVVVAPPVALGVMRKHYGPNLQRCIVKEIAADYVKMPVSDIAVAVSRALE
jgi:protein required for attachment to host cells